MKQTIARLAFLICLLMILTSCESQTDAPQDKPTVNTGPETPVKPQKTEVLTTNARPPTTTKALIPFQEPTSPVVYELPSGALATWREFSGNKPTLLLFSTHPFLEPLPEEFASETRQLLQNGTTEEISRRGRLFVADPAFFPLQTVSAALDSNLLAELIVVLPLHTPPGEMSLPPLQNQLLGAGFLTEAESSALTLQDGIISGEVRGFPLRLVHPDKLPELTMPLLLHVDLGYFKSLYVNEVKTPAFNLLFKTAEAIRQRNYQTLAITLSYSNQEIGLSLNSRFMIRSLAETLRNPALLMQQPDSWKILAQSLQMGAMFMESTARELLFSEAERGAEDPAFLLALATAQFQERQTQDAFATIDKAVALDPGYALEYLDLAQKGIDLELQNKALGLLAKAANAFPQDPFIRLQQAEYLVGIGRGQEAVPIIRELTILPWSQHVHPGVPKRLEELLVSAQEPAGKTGSGTAAQPERADSFQAHPH